MKEIQTRQEKKRKKLNFKKKLKSKNKKSKGQESQIQAIETKLTEGTEGTQLKQVPNQQFKNLNINEEEFNIPKSLESVFNYFEEKENSEVKKEEEMQEESTQADTEMDKYQEAIPLSNKQKRKLLRPTITQLKYSSERPDVIEQVDVTAKDPYFLVFLKSYKNTIEVPKH